MTGEELKARDAIKLAAHKQAKAETFDKLGDLSGLDAFLVRQIEGHCLDRYWKRYNELTTAH